MYNAVRCRRVGVWPWAPGPSPHACSSLLKARTWGLAISGSPHIIALTHVVGGSERLDGAPESEAHGSMQELMQNLIQGDLDLKTEPPWTFQSPYSEILTDTWAQRGSAAQATGSLWIQHQIPASGSATTLPLSLSRQICPHGHFQQEYQGFRSLANWGRTSVEPQPHLSLRQGYEEK